MTKIALLTGTMLACLHGDTAWADDWSHKYSFSGPPELRLEAVDAGITIRGGDVSWIEAQVTTSGWKIGESGVTVVGRQTGDRLDFGVVTPRDFFSIGRRAVHVDLIVPRKLTAAGVRTSEGKLSVEGFGGNNVRLYTADGQVEAYRMDGSLDAESKDGPLKVSGRFDRLNLKTRDGGVDVTVESGSKMAIGWRLQTGNGSVNIGLAEGFACNLDAKAGDGEVKVDVPLTVSHRQGASNLRAQINGGGAVLVVRTADGSIHIRNNPK